MPTLTISSANGWPTIPSFSDKQLATLPIPGCRSRTLTLNKDVLPLFLGFAAHYHKHIRSLNVGSMDEWSYRQPPKFVVTPVSNHCSGTAIDLNASQEGAVGPKNYKWWASSNHSTVLGYALDAFDVIEWNGPISLGGVVSNSTPNFWDFGHFALKEDTTKSDVDAVIADLGIDKRGNVSALIRIS